MNQTNPKESHAVNPVEAHPENASPHRAEHEDDHDHGHPPGLARDQPRPVRRCGSGGYLVSSRRIESVRNCHRCGMHFGWRLSDLPRSLRKHKTTANDDGAFDGYRHRRCSGDSRNFYGSCHHTFRSRRRDSGGTYRRPRPQGNSTSWLSCCRVWRPFVEMGPGQT